MNPKAPMEMAERGMWNRLIIMLQVCVCVCVCVLEFCKNVHTINAIQSIIGVIQGSIGISVGTIQNCYYSVSIILGTISNFVQ